jgi:hypothetical protein
LTSYLPRNYKSKNDVFTVYNNTLVKENFENSKIMKLEEFIQHWTSHHGELTKRIKNSKKSKTSYESDGVNGIDLGGGQDVSSLSKDSSGDSLPRKASRATSAAVGTAGASKRAAGGAASTKSASARGTEAASTANAASTESGAATNTAKTHRNIPTREHADSWLHVVKDLIAASEKRADLFNAASEKRHAQLVSFYFAF